MWKFHLCIMTSFLFLPASFAEVIQNTETTNGFSSIAHLQSIKNIQENTHQNVPYVHELNNRFHVRSLFVESPTLPIIDIQLTFNAGSARDSEIGTNLYGLSNMAAQLMDEGTTNYTAQEIISTFESVGAKFSVAAYRDMFIIKLRTLSDPEKLQPALAMMLEVLNHSTFKTPSIDLMLSNTAVGQKQLKENPDRMKNIVFYRTLYDKHPYAEPITGTQSSIKRISPENLIQFRKQFLVRNNLNIAITGQLTLKEALKLSEKIAKQLPTGNKADPLPAPNIRTDFNIRHIPYASSQAHIIMGEIGTTRDDPDYLALQVANRIFGTGGFNSILNQELRVKRGLTYGAYSNFNFMQVAGPFSLGYSTEQEHLLESIQIAHQALINFINTPIDQQQLEETKLGMMRAFPNNYSSNATINAQLGAIGFYHLPADYLNHYGEKLNELTAIQVQNAIRKHLHPDRLTIVIFSKNLDKSTLEHILQENLNTSKKLAPPKTTLPKMGEQYHPPKEEAPLPDSSLYDMPASISSNDLWSPDAYTKVDLPYLE